MDHIREIIGEVFRGALMSYVKANPGKSVNGSLPMGSDLERATYQKCMMGKGYKKG